MSANHLPVACQTKFGEVLDVYDAAKEVDPTKAGDVVTNMFKDGLAHKKPNGWMMFNEYLINAMLSGTGTPIVNFLSNTIQTLAKPTLDLINAYTPKVFSKMSQSQIRAERRAARAAISSIFDGWAQDSVFFTRGIKSGLPADFMLTPKSLGLSQKQFNELMVDSGASADVDGNVSPEMASMILNDSYDYMSKSIPGALGTVVRFPTRATVAIDEYFKARLRSQKAMALLSKKASLDSDAGLGSYDALYKQYKDEVFVKGDRNGLMDRLEVMFEADDDFATAMLDIRNYATDGTFQTKLKGNLESVSQFRGEGRTLGQTIAIQTVPFLRTPWNIMTESSGYVPLLGMFLRPNKTVAKVVRDDAGDIVNVVNKVVDMPLQDMVARQAVGFGIVVGMHQLFQNGVITGAEPEDPAERQRWRANGIQPMSIKVGDQWVSYSRAEPFATVLGLSADVFEFERKYQNGDFKSYNDEETTKKVLEEARKAGWSALKSHILSKTFMQGFADLSSGLFAPEGQGVQTVLDSYAKRVVPAALNTIARGLDPYEREATTTLEKMQQRMPLLREELSPKYSPYSADPNNIQPQRTNRPQAVFGIAVGQEPTDFQKRVEKLGIAFSPKSVRMDKVEMSSTQLSDYKKFINQAATQLLAESLPSLEMEPNKVLVRNYVEQRLMPAVTKQARFMLIEKYPKLYEQILAQTMLDKYGVIE